MKNQRSVVYLAICLSVASLAMNGCTKRKAEAAPQLSESAKNVQKSSDDLGAHLQKMYDEHQKTLQEIVVKQQTAEEQLYKWRYETKEDKMTNSEIQLAHLEARNKLNFSFPYDGGSYSKLMIRQRKSDGLSVLFSISPGQIVCNSTCIIKVRFDDKSPMTFRASVPADYNSASLFLEPASKFVAEVKKAKKTLVEVIYYQAGSRISEFNTEGFTWGGKSTK